MKMNILKKAVMACSVAGLVAVGCVSVAQADYSQYGAEATGAKAQAGNIYVLICPTDDTVAPDGKSGTPRAAGDKHSLICYNSAKDIDLSSETKYVVATIGPSTYTNKYTSDCVYPPKKGDTCSYTQTVASSATYDLSGESTAEYLTCDDGWSDANANCTPSDGSTKGTNVGCWTCNK